MVIPAVLMTATEKVRFGSSIHVQGMDRYHPIPYSSSDNRFCFAGLAVDRQNPDIIMVTSMNAWWPDEYIFAVLTAELHGRISGNGECILNVYCIMK